MRNRKSLGAQDDQTDINISPLIDMVFILLIFFIVTTVFVEEKGLAANTPDPTSNPQNDEERELVNLLIRRNGQVINSNTGQEIGINGVRGIVAPAMNRSEDDPVTIAVEPEVPVYLVVAVIDEAKSARAKQITMKTVSGE